MFNTVETWAFGKHPTGENALLLAIQLNFIDFDVWLTQCSKPQKTTAEKAPDADSNSKSEAGAADAEAPVNDAYDPNAEVTQDARRKSCAGSIRNVPARSPR